MSLFSRVYNQIRGRISLFFSALRWRGEPRNLEPDKCDELGWWPLDRLPLNMVPYVRQALALWQAGSAYSEFGWPSAGAPRAVGASTTCTDRP